MIRTLLVAVVGVLVCGCGGSTAPSRDVAFQFDFGSGAQGWNAGFADYPRGQEMFYELASGHRELPAPIGPGRSALFISGNNHSDDLFMFFKRRIDGLQPKMSYDVGFSVEIATDVPSGCGGVGGSPGESVWVKAGASAVEPAASPDASGHLRLNVDKGQQAVGGTAAIVLGTIGNTQPCEVRDGQLVRRWELKSLSGGSARVSVRTDGNGAAWLLIGTDSGFEATTALYYTRIVARFVLIQSPA